MTTTITDDETIGAFCMTKFSLINIGASIVEMGISKCGRSSQIANLVADRALGGATHQLGILM